MEVQGTIKMIGITQSFGSKGFEKRELVVVTDEKYPQPILIEFVQDKVTDLDNFAEGETVKVGVNLRGREWVNPQGETKYFNSIQGWRIEKLNQVATASQEPQGYQDTGDSDDLPF